MKKVKLPCLRNIFLSILFLLLSTASQARHILGVDLYYTWVSGETYQITLVAYGTCGLTGGGATSFAELSTSSPHICIYDGSTLVSSIDLTIQAPTSGVNVTPVCPREIDSTNCTNPSYTTPGVYKFVYTGNYTVPYGSSVWRFIYLGYMGPAGAGAARTAGITNVVNVSNTFIDVEDTLNNTINNFHNSSPVLTTIATPYFCIDEPANYNPGAVDPDGDSLSFALVPAKNSGTTNANNPDCASTVPIVSYIAPATATAPLTASGFSFNSQTGQISFTPTVLQRSLVVYNIEEYRNDTLIGTSQREMSFLVQTCSNTTPGGMIDTLSTPTNGAIVDNTHFHICQNSGAFNLSINPVEPGSTNNITDSVSGLPAGCTFTTTGNGTPTPHSVISWTSNTAPGSYTIFVTFKDDNCPLPLIQTLAYTMTILASPTINVSLLSGATCTAKAAANVVPGGTSPWTINETSPTAGNATFTNVTASFTDSLVPGSYKFVILTDPASTCTDSVSITVDPPIYLNPAATAFTSPTYCGNNDGTITIAHLIPGSLDTIQYYFNGVLQTQAQTVAADSTLTLTGLIAGAYGSFTYVTAKAICAPGMPGPFTLIDPSVSAPVITNNTPICEGQSLFLTAADNSIQGGTYSWTFPNGTTTTVQNPSIATTTIADSGLYTVTFIISPNCFSSASNNILVFPPIALTNLTASTVIPYGSSIHLNVDGGLYYWWKPDDGSLSNPNINDPIATPKTLTIYTVVATSLYGCSDSATITIGVDPTESIFIPTAFTPNNDGLNDIFRIGHLKYEQLNEFSVYNRWGQLVYHNTFDPQQGWDGTYNGVPQDMGVYNYIIVLSYPDGTIKAYKGDVTLIR